MLSDFFGGMAATKSLSRFRTKLILLILLAAVPAFGLVIFGYLEQRRIERAGVRDAAIATSRLAAITQKNFVENTRQLLRTLTQFPFLLLATNKTFCEEHFSNLRKLSPDYVNFGLIETNGDLFCSSEPTNLAINLSDRLYFQRALQTGKFAVGDLQIGRVVRAPTLSFGQPVFDERGNLKRVLYASLKISRLSEVLRDIDLPPESTITVFDRVGGIVARYPDPATWVGQHLSDVPMAKMTLTGTNEVFEADGLDGVPRLYAVTTISEGQTPRLLVSVGIPVSILYAHANETLLRNAIILTVVAIIMLLIVRYFARRFLLQPMNALDKAAHRLAEGELGARVGGFQGPEELVELGHAFDHMADRLQKRQTEIEEAKSEITQLNQDLERRVKDRTAQVEAAKKELESFSYSVSHDLRAPLRHVIGFADLIAKEDAEKLSDRSKRYLKTIGESGQKMGNLVDALLSYLRMGRAELNLENVDLKSLTHGIVESLQPNLGDRDVQWQIGDLPQVHADGVMLRTVLMNLIDNALKFSHNCHPIQIEIASTPVTSTEFVIFVRDKGVGFDMQYVDKLFGVFHRLHHSDEFEGIGVGLANVRRIIQRHGGRTWAEGKVNGGATFYFSLPKITKGSNAPS